MAKNQALLKGDSLLLMGIELKKEFMWKMNINYLIDLCPPLKTKTEKESILPMESSKLNSMDFSQEFLMILATLDLN